MSSGLAGVECTYQGHADLEELVKSDVKALLVVLRYLSSL
jgi:hypothetical protein